MEDVRKDETGFLHSRCSQFRKQPHVTRKQYSAALSCPGPITHPPWITSPPCSVLSPQLILPLLTSLQALSTLTQSTHCADWSSPSHTVPSTCQNPNVSGGVLPFHPPEKALFTKNRVASVFRPSTYKHCCPQHYSPGQAFTHLILVFSYRPLTPGSRPSSHSALLLP